VQSRPIFDSYFENKSWIVDGCVDTIRTHVGMGYLQSHLYADIVMP
jgi:hypothetical protein